MVKHFLSSFLETLYVYHLYGFISFQQFEDGLVCAVRSVIRSLICNKVLKFFLSLICSSWSKVFPVIWAFWVFAGCFFGVSQLMIIIGVLIMHICANHCHYRRAQEQKKKILVYRVTISRLFSWLLFFFFGLSLHVFAFVCCICVNSLTERCSG